MSFKKNVLHLSKVCGEKNPFTLIKEYDKLSSVQPSVPDRYILSTSNKLEFENSNIQICMYQDFSDINLNDIKAELTSGILNYV